MKAVDKKTLIKSDTLKVVSNSLAFRDYKYVEIQVRLILKGENV